MVLCTDEIRVALVTTHLPIAKVAAAITKDAIKEKLGIFNLSLKRDFAIDAPRILAFLEVLLAQRIAPCTRVVYAVAVYVDSHIYGLTHGLG